MRPTALCLVALVGLAAAACGGDDAVDATVDDAASTTSVPEPEPEPEPPRSTDVVPSPEEVPAFAADSCVGDVGRFAAAQFALEGIVREVELRVHPWDIDPENPDYNPDPTPVPWVTFDVAAWFTADRGSTNKVWMRGLDPIVGQTLLVGGNSYLVDLDGESHDSGGVDPCLAEPADDTTRSAWDDNFGGSVVPESGEPEGDADPAVVADIEDAWETWRGSEPASYSITISGTTDAGSSPRDCRGGAVRVVVLDGEVEQAVSIYGACEVDPALVPTVDDLFAQAIDLAGAGDFSVELFADETTPISYHAFDRSVSASGRASDLSTNTNLALVGWDAAGPAIDDAEAAWTARPVRGYEGTFVRTCFCPVGRYLVTVVDSMVVNLRTEAGVDVDPTSLPEWDIVTVEGIFATVAGMRGDGNVVAVLDPSGRWPTDVWFDPHPTAIDDELEVHVDLFETIAV